MLATTRPPSTHAAGPAGSVLGCLVLCTAHVHADCPPNLVPNAGFSQGNTGFTSDYGYSPGSCWNAGVYDLVQTPNECHGAWSSFGDHTTGDGLMMVVNGAATPDLVVWTVTVPVQPNEQYVFSLWLASSYPQAPAALQISINGDSVGVVNAPAETGIWEQFVAPWTSNTQTSATIEIIDEVTAFGGNDFALDDISFELAGNMPTVPCGFTVELVSEASGTICCLSVAPETFGPYGGQVFATDSGRWENLFDDSVLRVDPDGNVSQFAAVNGNPGPLRFAPLQAGGELMVSSSQDPGNPNYGMLSVVSADGTVTYFGSPTPSPAGDQLFGGVDLAWSLSGKFGDYVYCGTGGGFLGDSITRLPPGGGGAELFHDFGLLDGSPTGLAFGHGTSGFTTDLYVGVYTSGAGIASGVYILNAGGGRTALVTADAYPSMLGINEIEFGPGGPFGEDLYAADASGQIFKVDSTGDVMVFASGTSQNFSGLAFDGTASLYFNDVLSGRLYRVSAATCPADVNGDGAVSVVDLLVLLGGWGPCADPCCPADVDCDGAVSVVDLLTLLAAWGPCP